ncbi:SPOR domain-containing protein [Neptunomonas phycophila]|uniref:SPOR domain-containing protein n=1 Tax=Neptunomonas phycophila TaxID=1572645 RepID=UPI001BE7EA0B|nr:SPOR domain-containing protein [Neptunomonas phycophila]MBT3146139.1 SPOR domain-containing protein [Neptunomonas phycophila]
MDIDRKKRIVGLLVVGLAAIAILPWLLTGEGYKERHLSSRIPVAPQMPEMVDIEPQSKPLQDTMEVAPVMEIKPPVVVQVDAQTAPADSDETVAEEAKKPVVGTNEPAPQLDEQNVPVAWTLQLASFKDEANARALRKQLVGAGHKVYTRRQAELYKVYVGPDLKRDRLEALKETLKNDFALDGIIIRFTTQ